MEYDLDTTMGFGKYKGELVEDVLDKDPKYLLWCLENVEQFEVGKALQDIITKMAHS